MKYIRLFLLGCAATLWTACSDDNGGLNSTNATVSFDNATATAYETDNLVSIPITVDGERNGMVKVTVEVESGTAIDEEHFMVTSRELVIPEGTSTVNLEMRILDDGAKINDDRTAKFRLTNVQGAKTGTNAECQLTIVDVDDIPYYQLMGKYRVTGYSLSTAVGDADFVVTISGGRTEEEMNANRERRYVVEGFDGQLAGLTEDGKEYWALAFNKRTNNVSYIKGEYYIEASTAFTGAPCDVAVAPFELNLQTGKMSPTSAINVTVSSDYKTITFPMNAMLTTVIYDHETQDYVGNYSAYYNVKLTRIE